MKFENLVNILILFMLFILNIFINNYNNYFKIIYLLINLYHIRILVLLLLNYNIKKKAYEISKFILMSAILNMFTYYFICDSNPIFCFIAYYIFFPNFYKAILITIIHTYFLSFYQFNEEINFMNKFENSSIQDSKLNLNLDRNRYSYSFRKYYFLSNLIKSCTKNKVSFIIFLLSLILFLVINIILFLNRIKFWIYFNNKEKTLPISSSKNTTFYITAMVVNMEIIIKNFIEQMKELISYLGKENVIISIVENGDSEDKTNIYLKEFQNYLNKNKIINKIVMNHEVDDPRKKIHPFKKYGKLRIQFYAELRNKCLEFLYELSNIDFNNTKIIFFNDIYFKYEDIIYLISTNNEDYDAVCAMDFSNIFYDRWVSIDLDGNSLLKNFPFFVNKEAQDLIVNHKPIRVFSCWNGVIIFTASPLKNKTLQFRYKRNNKKPKFKINNCIDSDHESECTYLHIDLFNLGYTKKFINPNVRVTYEYKYYKKRKYFYPSIKDIISYFYLYLKSLKIKRNKFMSNYKDKNITFNKMVENWYLENK